MGAIKKKDSPPPPRRPQAVGARTVPLVLLGTLLMFGSGTLHAQDQRRTLASPRPTAEVSVSPAAENPSPRLLRARLLAIHGFSKAGLEGASAGVPEILRRFIMDPAEPMVVKRQAVKALALYPSEENFGFIRDRIDQAPLALTRLYAGTLKTYAVTRPADVSDILEKLLARPEASLRHSALALAASLPPSPQLQTLLQERLEKEPDPGVRRAIRRLAER